MAESGTGQLAAADLVSPAKDTTKKYLFTISEDEYGMRVEFDSMKNGAIEEDLVMTITDVSLITVSLVKLLSDEGMTTDQLQEFMQNIIEMSTEAKVEGDLDGAQEEQAKEQEVREG